MDLFNTAEVDAISIASLFHYKNIQAQENSKLKGSNAYAKGIKEEDKFGMSVFDLKKYLLSKNIKLRI